MRYSTLALTISLALGATHVARAQPAPGDDDLPPTPSMGHPAPAPTPAPAPGPGPAPAPAPAPAQPSPPAEPLADRPQSLAFAVGAGYSINGTTSLETPNLASVRVRLTSGLQFEPFLRLAHSSTTTDTGTGAPTTTDATSELGFGALVRFPLIKHKHTDLELLGSLSFDTQTVDPDGDNNNTTTTTIAVGYGIAVGYWLSPHLQVSLSATNSLLSYTKSDTQVPGADDMTSSTTAFALQWDPQVFAMIHLYN